MSWKMGGRAKGEKRDGAGHGPDTEGRRGSDCGGARWGTRRRDIINAKTLASAAPRRCHGRTHRCWAALRDSSDAQSFEEHCQPLLAHGAVSDAEHGLRHLRIRLCEKPVVEAQEDAGGHKARSFVPVDEWMVARNVERVGSCLVKDGRVEQGPPHEALG